MSLPTVNEAIISGLRFFLESNKDTKIGEPLAIIYHPIDRNPRNCDGICFYLKAHLWWHVLPEYYDDKEETRLVNTIEEEIDELIKPYLPSVSPWLPQKGIFTEQRLQIVNDLLHKLSNKDN